MTNSEIILNIAVNLGRIGKFALEGRKKRIQQFLEETDGYIQELQLLDMSPKLQTTISRFVTHFSELKDSAQQNEAWAESMFTWENILIHRAHT